MRLSKSRFTAGLQCERQLWWRVHEPEAPELVPDAALQALFDVGHRVGAAARERVPGGVLIDLPHDAIAERAEATRKAIQEGAQVIYEASFFANDTFVAVDILERLGDDWRLVEVKSSAKVKPEYLPDVAVQLHVLRRAGLPVAQAQLMHLNRQCVHPELDDLFTRADVMADVAPLMDQVPRQIDSLLTMLHGSIPDAPIGPRCDDPHECPFKGRCWPARPRHHVSTLYNAGKRAWDLEADGYVTVDQVPDDLLRHPAAARQKQAILENRLVVEPGLADALDRIERPVAILDFETVMPAIPVWRGCRPFDQVPVQFSCHAEDGNGGWAHHGWIASGSKDPRPELVDRLTEACRGIATILAYNAPFERHCLEEIGAALPDLSEAVEHLVRRIEDARPLVLNHVYHPDFNGSFSLKSVLPALVPGLSYESLEIAEGRAASRALEDLLLRGKPADAGEQARLREALLCYCEMDTWGVVKLLERLRALARAEGP